MTSPKLPLQLPLARPFAIGLPYHGLVTNEVLTLPNSDEIEIAFAGHQTVLVQAADPPELTYTEDEEDYHDAQGYTWQDYALLSGLYREIGGIALGAQSYLYHDGDHAWIIDVELSADDLELTLDVYLRQLFGYLRVGAAPPAMSSRRLLDSITWQPVSYTGTLQGEEQAAWDRYVFMTHSSTGAVSAVNVATTNGSSQTAFFGPGFGYQYGGGYVVHDAFKIDISGTGSVEETVGSGISATITHLANADEMYDYSDTETGSPSGGWVAGSPSIEELSYSDPIPVCTGSTQTYDLVAEYAPIWDSGEDGADSGSRITSSIRLYYAAVTSSGSITWLEYETKTTTNWSWSESSSGALTYTEHKSMGPLPLCSISVVDIDYSGTMTWTKESTSTALIETIIRFGGQAYTQTITKGTHELYEWEGGESVEAVGAVLVTQIRAINEDTPEYITACSVSGLASKTCDAQYEDYWYCDAIGSVGGLQMVEPQVFRISATAGCGSDIPNYVYGYRLISCNGDSLSTYTDSPGASARLVSYHPKTGEFAVADTSTDLVVWV